jgi:ribosomal protein L7/L12
MSNLAVISNVIDRVDVSKVAETLGRINQFQAIVQSTLKKDQDYGVIAGTQKPTLLKPGAEKILMLMGMTSEYEITEKVEDYEKDIFAYTMKCMLYNNGQKITEGVGSCNSKEDKYRWRWINEDDLPLGTDKMTLKSKTNNYGKVKYRIENDDICSQVNTILKMAKKRAQIDATLTVGSLSEIFTQDLEDLAQYQEKEQLDNLKPEEVGNIKVTFGKHKGKTLGEVLKEAPDYITWLAENAKEAVMKKACEQLLHPVDKSANKSSAPANTQPSNKPVDYTETPFPEDDFPPFDETDIPN